MDPLLFHGVFLRCRLVRKRGIITPEDTDGLVLKRGDADLILDSRRQSRLSRRKVRQPVSRWCK